MNAALWATLLLTTLGSSQSQNENEQDPTRAQRPPPDPLPEEDGLDDTTIIVIVITCTTVGIVIVSVLVFYLFYIREPPCVCGALARWWEWWAQCCCTSKDLDPPEPLDLQTPGSADEAGNNEVPELPPPATRRAPMTGRDLSKTAPRRPLALDPKPEPKTVKTRISWRQAPDDARKIYCVQVQGSWDNYGHFQTLQFYGKGLFQLEMDLKPAENLYRFLVDGHWCIDDQAPKKWSGGYQFNCLDTRPERGNAARVVDKNYEMDQELLEIPFVNMNFREKVQVWFERNGLGEKARRIVKQSEAQSFEELRSMDRQDIRKLADKVGLSRIEEEKLTKVLQKPSGLEE